ncbi:MAG TPA: ABC transporter permease [Chthoniobacterales bacterium]
MRSLAAIASVARKEFLHIARDRRVLILLITLPPIFTLVFGHAFEAGAIKEAPAVLVNADATPRTQRFLDKVLHNETFKWRVQPPDHGVNRDLLQQGVQATLVIPQGWSDGLTNGKPVPLQLYLDASDTNIAPELYGSVQESLGEFQMDERKEMIDALPQEVFDMAEKIPIEVRHQFTSAMEPWSIDKHNLYNPKERFIDYVIPGVIGLILQLITVTLMASTIARERESGTLYQLMVTALRRREIVIGKLIPYLCISIVLILMIVVLAGWHFGVVFYSPGALAVICVLFLLCSLGLGLLISAFSRTQTQAIQFSVFFLLPVFVLSGAFAPLQQLPAGIRWISEIFPLTHFCRAFRLVNLYHAGIQYYAPSLIALAIGVVVTFVAAVMLLRRIEQ